MQPTTIAVDVAKSVFEVAVSDQPGQVRERVEMEDFFMCEIVEQGKVLYDADHA